MVILDSGNFKGWAFASTPLPSPAGLGTPLSILSPAGKKEILISMYSFPKKCKLYSDFSGGWGKKLDFTLLKTTRFL